MATAKRALGKLSFASMASDLGGEPSRGGPGYAGAAGAEVSIPLGSAGMWTPQLPSCSISLTSSGLVSLVVCTSHVDTAKARQSS